MTLLKIFKPEVNMYWATDTDIDITKNGNILIGNRTFKTEEEKALSAIILRLNAAAKGWKHKYENQESVVCEINDLINVACAATESIDTLSNDFSDAQGTIKNNLKKASQIIQKLIS